MDFPGTCLTEGLNPAAGGIAPYQGIVDYHDSLVLDHAWHHGKFKVDTVLSLTIVRHYEGSANIVVTNKPMVQGDATLLRIAEGGRTSAVGDRYHQVGIDWMFFRQTMAQLEPYRMYTLAEDITIRPSEVNMFKDALPQRSGNRFTEVGTANPLRIDGDQLSRHNIPDELGSHLFDGAGFAGKDKTTPQFSNGKWAKPEWVTGSHNALSGHQKKGKGSTKFT